MKVTVLTTPALSSMPKVRVRLNDSAECPAWERSRRASCSKWHDYSMRVLGTAIASTIGVVGERSAELVQ